MVSAYHVDDLSIARIDRDQPELNILNIEIDKELYTFNYLIF